jgi:hypothetical protein
MTMENILIIIVAVAVLGVAYKFFFKKETVKSAPAKVVKAVAKAPAKVVEVRKAPTKAQLSSKTKKELGDYAKIEWAITLDAKNSKDNMIATLIKETKAVIKAEQK